MHDPTAIFRFEEHDIYIPMTVLEELDAGKKGLSEPARNVRQVSRFLDELMQGATKKQIDRGLALPTTVPINHGKRPPGGRLFFQTQLLESVLPDSLPGQGADNAILANTLALQQKFRTARVTLVSKDINLRIKALKRTADGRELRYRHGHAHAAVSLFPRGDGSVLAGPIRRAVRDAVVDGWRRAACSPSPSSAA